MHSRAIATAGCLLTRQLNPGIAVRNTAGGLELDARVRLSRLSLTHRSTSLSLAVSAVVEDDSGKLSYWALGHPPGKPDFHHPDAFALEFDEIRN